MKILLTLSLLVSTAVAGVEIRTTVDNTHCVLKDSQVTKTVTLRGLKFTTYQDVEFEGLEKVAEKAAKSSTGNETYYKYELVLNGTNYALNPQDSLDSMTLTSMMSKVCKFN